MGKEAVKSLNSAECYRFGEFELDCGQWQLRRGGHPIRLERIPMTLLILLVENAGRLVEREAIYLRIWGSDVNVDHEHGVNVAIRKIRRALGDSSESPRFVETVVGRGYRFITPAEAARDAARAEVPKRPWGIGVAAGGLILAACTLFFASDGTRPTLSGGVPLTSDPTPKIGPVVADGKRVFYTEVIGGRAVPFSVPISGGAATPAGSPFPNSRIAAISGDGATLFIVRWGLPDVSDDSELWTIPVSGGAARRAVDLAVRDGAPSPDGRALALVHHNSLMIAAADGHEMKTIATFPGQNVFRPVWSPDGRGIRVVVARFFEGLDSQLWNVRIADGSRTLVLPDWKGVRAPASGTWLRDGKTFVFDAHPDAGQSLFFQTDARPLFRRTGQVERLFAGPIDFWSPAVGQDGRNLFALGLQRRGELVRWDSAAGSFIPFLGGISAEMLDFSRDGRKVVYSEFPEDRLIHSDVSGDHAMEIRTGMRAVFPRWAPDGNSVVFSGIEGTEVRIYVADLRGGMRAAAPRERGERQIAPSWSPDGRSILYASFPLDMMQLARNTKLRIADLDHGSVRDLPGSGGLFNQRWLPDGRIIATPTTQEALLVFDDASGSWKPLVTGAVDNPVWAAGVRSIYFERQEGTAIRMCRVPGAGGPVECVATTGNLERAGHRVFGPWLGVTPDGSPLVLRHIGNEQVYRFDLSAR